MSVERPTSTIADHALAEMARLWGLDARHAFWEQFAPPWRERLAGEPESASRPQNEDPRLTVRQEHESFLGCRASDVHPSWFVRALQDESPAVRRAVIAGFEGTQRAFLLRELGLDAGDLETDLPPSPLARSWVRHLWTERLVGGRPVSADDPPVVVTLASLPTEALSKFAGLVGLARCAGLPDEELGSLLQSPRNLDRVRAFRREATGNDPQGLARVRADLARAGGPTLKVLPRLGLMTLGRLLAVVEPHRARWTLQHLPYPVARTLRGFMDRDDSRRARDARLDGESRSLELARERLREENVTPPSEGG